jgi:hypothetical protein
MSFATQNQDWNNPSYEPLSNGPIRVVTGPAQARFALDSDRWEMEYLLPVPFHALDPSPWDPLSFTLRGIPITVYRPVGTLGRHQAAGQTGNEEVDSYCTIIRLSRPNDVELSPDEGWRIVRQLLEWIRVKCRHYWLLHGINGFGAAYRGTLFTRENNRTTQQNLAMYGPNVIVNPLTREIWKTLAKELEEGSEPPIEDALYCDSLLSIVAGNLTKALLEAGVALEVALTRLLVDVAGSQPSTPAKKNFIRKQGDRDSSGKKLAEWTRALALDPIEAFIFPDAPPDWLAQVRILYQMRNGVAHGGAAGSVGYIEVVRHMFAANALLEYVRTQRLKLGLKTYSMPTGATPARQLRLCHEGCISTSSNVLTGFLLLQQ